MTRLKIAALAVLLPQAAVALEEGRYAIRLEAADGTTIEVAQAQLDQDRYSLSMADAPFSDHFLSMRPFKCLEGPEKLWCHVPYPYEINRDLSGDLTDLEYDMLFVWKPAGEYGIDLWNGVYYRLQPDGDGLRGMMHEMDMNLLAVPPAQGELRPISPQDIEPADPSSHWLPVLRVMPVAPSQ
jgi:hypothetical protein